VSGSVIVVGAGPAGLMLACELGLHGVPAIVLERLAEPAAESRSMGLQSRTVEIFHERGVADEWFRDFPAMVMHNFGLIRLTQPRGDYPPSLRVPQSSLEKLLAKRAVELGAEVRRGHEVIAVEQDDAGVTVTVRTADGEQQVRGDYLVGCDGGASTVRRSAGIDFPGTDATLSGVTGQFVLADDGSRERVSLAMNLVPEGFLSTLPQPDGVTRLTAVEFGVVTPRDAPTPNADDIRAMIKRIGGPDLTIDRTLWIGRFADATRHAERYRSGRVFLAGDAAHIHFPAAGQGLNTGVQDAVNLGWKLAAEVNGWAPAGLLDTYHGERHPVGARVCANTRAQMALTHPIDRVGPLREFFTELIQLDEVNKYLIELVTGISIRYPFEESGAQPHPLLGRRMPHIDLETDGGVVRTPQTLNAGRGVLLHTGATPPDLTGWQGRVGLVTAKPHSTMDAEAVLVRPDGHVVYAGDGTGLDEALVKWFGQPSTATGERN